jgi:hypothetical protein
MSLHFQFVQQDIHTGRVQCNFEHTHRTSTPRCVTCLFMSSVSSLADASSTDDIVCTQGATVHDDLSFMKVCADVQARTHENGKKSSILPQGANIASLKHQLFLKATEARRWQDSVLHLSSVVTGKEEELNRERERNAEMAEELERVQGTAHEYRVEMDRVRNEHHHATKQVHRVVCTAYRHS